MSQTWGDYYNDIASQMALFRQSNQSLVAAAELQPGMRVIDLGCGSGLTSLAALEAVPEGLELILVDSSPSMVEAARRRVGARASAYHVADAADLAPLVAGKVDRVLCNLALWYFKDPEAVLRQLRKVIKPTGRLCFSLLGTFFNAGGDVVSPHWAFLKVLAERGLIARALPAVDRLPNQRSIEGTLQGAGFKPFFYKCDEIAAGPEELEQWLRLYPVADGATRAEAAAHSLAWLADTADAVAAYAPRWRTVVFQAQPAVSPEEILMERFGGKLPGPGGA
jgi:SAM-dependent methyltransferase